MHEPTCVSLFSGVGGLDEGLRRAGFRHLLMCEADAYRRDVLAARFPGVQVRTDVRNIWIGHRPTGFGRQAGSHGGERIEHDSWARTDTRRVVWAAGSVDLLAGGTPCQDLSVAGNRAGLAGDRSGLFFEYARVVDAFRPGWILWENVPGAFSSNGGRDFGIVLGTLADLGYGVGWRVLDSRFFGVPQRRRRVFIVGARADGDPHAAAERAGQVLAVGSRCGRHSATRGEAGQDVAVASLCGLGTGGPDDNDGQGGRLVAETVRSHPRPGSNSNGNMVAFNLRGREEGARVEMDDVASIRASSGGSSRSYVAAPLTSGGHPNSNAPGRRKEDDENLVAFNWQTGGDFHPNIGPESPALQKEQTVAVQDGAMVRRLTPVECERLQAFPDGWTDLGGTADSKRYAALGDAVTVNVAEWIGLRIVARLRQREAA